MKKQPPPKLSKAELKAEALKLLAGSKDPVEAVEFLLDQFNGWDLEDLITKLRQEAVTKELRREISGKPQT